jgi:hypothetical protein
MRYLFCTQPLLSKIKDFFFQNVRWFIRRSTPISREANLTSLWELDQTVPGVLSQINPSAGAKSEFKASYQLNDFFEDYATKTTMALCRNSTPNILSAARVALDRISAQSLLPTHGITVDLQAGWIDRRWTVFFHSTPADARLARLSFLQHRWPQTARWTFSPIVGPFSAIAETISSFDH